MRGIKDFVDLDVYNRPVECPECGGVMVFKGCGEYKCEKCKYVAYDDYGKVRNYVEGHSGVTMAQAADATGVKQKTIRTMLKESRLEVADGSSVYLKCEMCGVSIRSGRVCSKCEVSYNKMVEDRARKKQAKMMAGFGMDRGNADDGAKRFKREQ